jgi:hypothetical protein
MCNFTRWCGGFEVLANFRMDTKGLEAMIVSRS